MEFVLIHPGTFMMGSPENEPGRFKNEVLHKVTLTKSFYMQTTQVTVGHWRVFAQTAGYKTIAEKEGLYSMYQEAVSFFQHIPTGFRNHRFCQVCFNINTSLILTVPLLKAIRLHPIKSPLEIAPIYST